MYAHTLFYTLIPYLICTAHFLKLLVHSSCADVPSRGSLELCSEWYNRRWENFTAALPLYQRCLRKVYCVIVYHDIHIISKYQPSPGTIYRNFFSSLDCSTGLSQNSVYFSLLLFFSLKVKLKHVKYVKIEIFVMCQKLAVEWCASGTRWHCYC